MRELTLEELQCVAGGTGVCVNESTGNNYGGVSNPGGIGDDLVSFYEGLVYATSYVIERVANAF